MGEVGEGGGDGGDGGGGGGLGGGRWGGEGGGGGVCGVRFGGVKRVRFIRHLLFAARGGAPMCLYVWRTPLVGLESTMRFVPSPGRVVPIPSFRYTFQVG